MDSAKTLTFLLYWIVLITGCILVFEENLYAASIIRAALMPVLGVYLYVNLKPTHSQRLIRFFYVAIGFLWLSDIFRIFINGNVKNGVESDNPLLLSIAASIIANVFFMLGYNKIRKIIIAKAVFPSLSFSVGCGLIYYMFFQFLNNDFIQPFKTPLILLVESYIFTFAFATNILDSNSKKRLSVKYFLPASFLALLSVVLFVFNRYKLFTPRFEMVVFLAYGYAQLLNVNGFRKTSK